MTTIASQSPASRLFTQPFIQMQIKENIKASRHWPLCGEFTGTGEFPAQRASNAENISIWWRHHDEHQADNKSHDQHISCNTLSNDMWLVDRHKRHLACSRNAGGRVIHFGKICMLAITRRMPNCYCVTLCECRTAYGVVSLWHCDEVEISFTLVLCNGICKTHRNN